MTDRELMQQALDALEVSTDWDMGATGKQAQSIRAITALRARLSQPEQEPVAWRNTETGEFCTGGFLRNQIERWQPLYTAPPQREWQGLTDEEITDTLINQHPDARLSHFQAARAIEAKLKAKNA